MKLDYSISDVIPYINWIYFFHAWGTSGMPQQDKERLKAEAENCLQACVGRYQTHAVFHLFEACSDGDDIAVSYSADTACVKIPFLRQQQPVSDFLCLADFVSPAQSDFTRQTNQLGVFATTVDAGMETDYDNDPYTKMMMQLLADRLAEATAERLHEEVRKHYWGYASDEQLTIAEMLQERFQGIRPAVGYPSLPDTSLNFVLDRLLDFKQIGIHLTESGAMKPHASVSGLMFAHPEARYFTVGKIGEDQLTDYARRRGVPVELMRKFLGGNL